MVYYVYGAYRKYGEWGGAIGESLLPTAISLVVMGAFFSLNQQVMAAAVQDNFMSKFLVDLLNGLNLINSKNALALGFCGLLAIPLVRVQASK